MALQDTTSRPFMTALIRSARSEIRGVVIEGANPRMHAAIQQIKANTAHVRKLNADSVIEIVNVLDDPELLGRIKETDKRVWVKEAATRQLSSLTSTATTPSRARYKPATPASVTVQTKAALGKEPIHAAYAISHMRAFDEALVAAWAAEVSEEDLAHALTIAKRTPYWSEGELAKVISDRLTSMSVSSLRVVLRGTPISGTILRNFIRTKNYVLDGAAAVALARAEEYEVSALIANLDTLLKYTVTKEAVNEWRSMPHTEHLLLYAGDLSREELGALIESKKQTTLHRQQQTLKFARRPEDIEFIVEESIRRGWWDNTKSLASYGVSDYAAFLTVSGLSEKTVLSLIPHMPETVAVRYALGEWGEPLPEAYRTITATVKLSSLNWVGENDPAVQLAASSPNTPAFVEDVLKGPLATAENVFSSWYGSKSGGFTQVLVDVLNKALDGNPLAWSMFVSFCEDAEETPLLDLAAAAVALT